MTAIAAALTGIGAAFQTFERAASRIARQPLGTAPGGDLVSDLVTIGVAKLQVQANVAVVRTSEQMVRTLLDMYV